MLCAPVWVVLDALGGFNLHELRGGVGANNGPQSLLYQSAFLRRVHKQHHHPRAISPTIVHLLDEVGLGEGKHLVATGAGGGEMESAADGL